MFRLFASALVLAVRLAAVQADDSTDGKKDEKDLTPKEMFKEQVRKVQSAKDNDARTEHIKTYTEKFLSYAEKNKDDKGAEALFYVLQIPGGRGAGSPWAKALGMLKKDHVRTTKLGKKLKLLPVRLDNRDTRELVKEIAEHNKDKETQAVALRILIKQSEQAADFAARVKDDADLKEKIDAAKGKEKEVVKQVLDLAAASEKDIKAYKAKLAKELKVELLDLSVGKPAPEVISQDVNGKKAKLSDLRGKVVVLDFWATWCPPCRAMIPHTRKLTKKMEGKPFAFVSISADAQKSTLEKFLKDNDMPWTQWWAGNEEGVIEDWEIASFPMIYILDAKGIIRKRIDTGGQNEAIEKEVEKLVKEAEDGKKSKTD